MLRTLLESGASPTRRAGGTIVSIAVHTGAIALAIVATARATVVVKPINDPWRHPVVYQLLPTHTDQSTQHTVGERPPGISLLPAIPRCQCVLPSMKMPTGLTIDAAKGLAQLPIDFGGGGALGGGVVDRAGLGSPGDVYPGRLVDKAAAPRPGNPPPVYPAALRSAQIEGTVLARFIVDSVGRAEPGSIEFPEATQAQFADAVRQSLLRSRYLPALVAGRAVRQLVEQRFAFTLAR